MIDPIKNLIGVMVDAGTLPYLDSEEIDELTYKAIDGLVPYILDVFEY